MTKSEEQFSKSHWEGLAIHVSEGIFLVRPDSLGDVILMPSEESDGFADCNKLEAELHLVAEPDVIPDDAIFGRVRATLPNLTAKQERAGLDRHMPIGIDEAGNSDLVEEIEEI